MSCIGLASRAGVRLRRTWFVRASAWTLAAIILCPPAIGRAQPPDKQKGERGGGQTAAPIPGQNGQADEHKLDAALRAWARRGTDGSNGADGSASARRVIVTSTPGADGPIGALIAQGGGRLAKTLPGIGAVVADVPRGLLAQLARDSRVVSISDDSSVLAVDGNLTSSNGAPRGDASLRAALGLPPSNPSADGIGVAIVDSGISPSADFAGRIAAFHDFTQGGIATEPADPYGHGTHVAGIIGSSGELSSHGQYRGVASSARLIGLRVLDEHGAGRTSGVIEAIEFAIAQRDALGIDVISLALGHPIYEPAASDPLVRAVERAVDAGIVVIASAGNFGYNRELDRTGYAGITSPGNAPSAITAGALRGADTETRGDDDVAPYSSRGPSWYDGFAKPDLLAPGHGIVSNASPSSTLYADYPSVRTGSSFMRLNGTSMAAATTTGVVALMLEAHRQTHASGPALAPNAIKAILQYTSTPLDARAGSPDALTQGAGAINAPAAIAAARAIDASTAIGDNWVAGTLSRVTVHEGETWSWNASITWRDTPLSGGDLLELNRVAWTSSVEWGQPLEWGADVLSGQNLVWSPSIDWASNVVWGSNLVGTTTDDQTFTWGYVEDPLRTVWADLDATATGGQTFCWGYTSSTAQTPWR
jgi:serine protease AprX